jgi:hypothetical protein
MQDKLALAGTRSGIAAASALNVLRSLQLHKDTKTFERVIEYSLDMAKYLEEKLNALYLPGQVKRQYFNVNFPKGPVPDNVIDKYILMRNGLNV